MDEQINNMETNVPVIEPQEETSTPVVKPKREKKPFKSGYVVGILLFLVICLMVGLTYYVLKDRGIDLLTGKTTTNTATTAETATDTTTTTDNGSNTACTTDTTSSTCKVSVDNEGWNLFSVPKYGLSVEVPTYSMIQDREGESFQNVWEAWFDPAPVYTTDGKVVLSGVLDYKLGTLYVNFYPQLIPTSAGCDQNCLKEQYINVDIYQNKDTQNLATVISTYRTKWETQYVDGDVTSASLKGETVTKWNTSVWSFEEALEGGTSKGYLVVTDSYIYEVKYTLSTTPTESYNIALKVLDSMKFLH